MHPIYQLIKIDTWIIYYYKDCDNTFKKWEHICHQLLQSFDIIWHVYSTNETLSYVVGLIDSVTLTGTFNDLILKITNINFVDAGAYTNTSCYY